jgi:hypothetical protein
MSRLRRPTDSPGVFALPELSDSPPVSVPFDLAEMRRARRREAAARRRRRRRRSLIVALFLGLLLWAIVSYSSYMLEPTSMTWSERSAEWVRQKVPFGNWIVDNAEHVYYNANAPEKGGPSPKRLPAVGLNVPLISNSQSAAGTLPPRIKPVLAQPLPGEGVWKPTGPPVDGGPPILVTTFRPELEYPELLAYVAWFDHSRTEIGYYPGRYEPPRAAVRGPMMVPYDQRWRLLATFNAGFTYEDGENGSTDNGRVNEPLKDGNATLVGYRDGRVAIVRWSGGANAGSGVAWARQSLAPILWNGRLNPALNEDPNSPQWGYTLGGRTRVWRTGVGIDHHGNLIYVAAEGQTVISLARIFQHIGSVRAMEFDINPEWHTLIVYGHHGRLGPTEIGLNSMQPSTRYLVPDDRDFFAVYRPATGPLAVPFK